MRRRAVLFTCSSTIISTFTVVEIYEFSNQLTSCVLVKDIVGIKKNQRVGKKLFGHDPFICNCLCKLIPGKARKLKKTSFDGCSAYGSNYALLPHLRTTAKCGV